MTQILLHTMNLLTETGIDASEVLHYDPTIILNVILAVVTSILSVDKIITWVHTKDNVHFVARKKHENLTRTVKENNEKIGELEQQLDAITIGVQMILKGQLMDNHTKYMTRQPEPYITDKEQKIWINMHSAYNRLGGNGVVETYNDDIVNKIKVIYQPDEN